ncbi:MAG: hypothetical protein HHJ14_07460 [Cellulomonas sp.]|nr:hypothetical protein [Cellulomonas sp.]
MSEAMVAVMMTTQEERTALARATLARAELLTGARSLRRTVSEIPVPEVPVPAAPVPEVPVPEVPVPRPRAGDGAPVRRTSLVTSERPSLPVPDALSALLPDGLRRGSTVAVLGSTSLVLALLAEACGGGAWAAVVGQPTVGLLAAAQAGVDLERLAVVPQPGMEAPTVIAALLDGVDVVLVGPEAILTDGDRRRLVSRARERGSVLLTSGTWPGADVVLTAERGRWSGVGAGDGRLRTCELRVTRTGRGGAGVRQSVELTLPLVQGVGAVAPAVPAAPAELVERLVPTAPLRLVG